MGKWKIFSINGLDILCRVSILGLIKFHDQSQKEKKWIIKVKGSGYTVKKMIEQAALT